MIERHIRFEWDERKARSNAKTHGVTFKEAETAFDDDRALIIDDESHSDEEPREILIGYSNRNRLIFVSFVQRLPNRVRIISARRADRRERRDYANKPRF